jgi:hypothetical protein
MKNILSKKSAGPALRIRSAKAHALHIGNIAKLAAGGVARTVVKVKKGKP